MSFVLKDRVKETSTSTGTGDMTLAGAEVGFQSFSVIGDGNQTYYAIVGGSEWEVGIGTYESTGPDLQRDFVLSSSNSGSLVNFSAGTKDVFVTYPSERAVFTIGSGVTSETGALYINKTTANVSATLNSGENAMSVGPITLDIGANVSVASGQRWMIL